MIPRPCSFRRYHKRATAFTLPELMVSMALTVILGVVLLSFFGSVLGAWNSTSARAESFGEARAALHLLNHELDLAIPGITASDGTVTASVTTDLEVASGKQDEALGFLCKVPPPLQPDGTNESDICGVVYFLSPTLDAAGSPTPGAPVCLYRRLIDSDTTCARLKDDTLPFTDETSPASAATEVVAHNVIDFEIVRRDANFQEIADTDTKTLPSEIDVKIKVIGARAAQTYFQADASDAVKQLIETREAREFTLRHRL